MVNITCQGLKLVWKNTVCFYFGAGTKKETTPRMTPLCNILTVRGEKYKTESLTENTSSCFRASVRNKSGSVL